MDMIVIKLNLKKDVAIVRKVVLHPDGTIDYKAALTREGAWEVIPEGVPYPETCQLPILDQTPSVSPAEWTSDTYAVSFELMSQFEHFLKQDQ